MDENRCVACTHSVSLSAIVWFMYARRTRRPCLSTCTLLLNNMSLMRDMHVKWLCECALKNSSDEYKIEYRARSQQKWKQTVGTLPPLPWNTCSDARTWAQGGYSPCFTCHDGRNHLACSCLHPLHLLRSRDMCVFVCISWFDFALDTSGNGKMPTGCATPDTI